MTTTVLPPATSRSEDAQQLLDVVEVEAGRGLVEDVERAARGALGELAGERAGCRMPSRSGERPFSDSLSRDSPAQRTLADMGPATTTATRSVSSVNSA